ncbi:MAG: hypothetical protein ACRCX4_12875 [Bacteroidales bacterium]
MEKETFARIEKRNKKGMLYWGAAFIGVWILTILIVNLLNCKNMSLESMSALFLWAIFTVLLCVVGANLFRFYYNRKLRNIKRFLAEIEHFEKEE